MDINILLALQQFRNCAGKMLVDGAKMASDIYKDDGWCIDFLLGWVWETQYIGFPTDVLCVVHFSALHKLF